MARRRLLLIFAFVLLAELWMTQTTVHSKIHRPIRMKTDMPIMPTVSPSPPLTPPSGGTSSISTTTPPNPPSPIISSYQIAEWEHVNECEEGGNWAVDGAIYSGGLGFSHANWDQFNTFGYPSDAAYATPEQQITVAVAFATYYYHNPDWAPDQGGCTGGY